jgi:hypothetical protein
MAKPLVALIVERARALVDNPDTWCQRSYALHANGRGCEALDAEAVRFCAYGALQRTAFDVTGKRALAEELAQKAAAFIVGRNAALARAFIIHTNDTRGREAVLKLFDQHLSDTGWQEAPPVNTAAPRRRKKVLELVH